MDVEAAERELSKVTKDFDSFMDGTRQWTLKRQLHGISVYTTPSTHFKGKVYRADSVINMAAQKIFDLIHPTAPYRFMWDMNVERCDLISEVMPGVVLVHETMKPMLKGFISARDSVDLIIQDEDEKVLKLFVTGVEYGPIPPQPKIVRVNTYPCGMIIRKTEYPEISNVTTFFQVDLNFPRTPQFLLDEAVALLNVAYLDDLNKAKELPWTPLQNVVGRKPRV